MPLWHRWSAKNRACASGDLDENKPDRPYAGWVGDLRRASRWQPWPPGRVPGTGTAAWESASPPPALTKSSSGMRSCRKSSSRRERNPPRFTPPARWPSHKSRSTMRLTGSWAGASRCSCASGVPQRLTRRRRGRRRAHGARRAAPQPAVDDRPVLPDVAVPDRLGRLRAAGHSLWRAGGNRRCRGTSRRRSCGHSPDLHPNFRARGIPADTARVHAGGVSPRLPMSNRSSSRAPASSARPPPPPLTSPQYAAQFNEVRSPGELNSTTRTADETAIGTFWGAAPIWIV